MTPLITTEDRARLSLGGSNAAIHAMVARGLARAGARGDLLDVGCGSGALWGALADRFDSYTGVDVVRYEGFPPAGRFVLADADGGAIPLPDASFDAVVAVETIEHLDGPRRFAAELARLVKPGGWLAITTPNQLSLHSLLSLLLRGYFAAFAEAPGLYPAHLTALLETDLLRVARELGLTGARVVYSDRGRIPLTARHWPGVLRGRRFSDNLMLVARRPAADADATAG
jgi:2-polyprenyl-3-methyl-5-hydroxy-6-metoxy-1,4-benzoquinol methylase